MQSSASESFARTLRNPTVLAMLGSAGVHIILVVISALKPAEGQPQRFQIVNLPPKASTNKLATNPTNANGSNLPVPNGLPPVSPSNLSPQLGALPDPSTFSLPPYQSFFTGTKPDSSRSRVSLNKLRTMDLPQRSFPNAQRPKSGWPTVANEIPPLQPPNTAQLPNLNALENSAPLPSSSNASQFSADQSKLPALASTPFSARESLYGQQPQSSPTPNTSAALSNAPGTESTGDSPNSSLESRTKLARLIESQRLRTVQKFSLQKGPQLIAAYPPESCSSQKNGTAMIYALYGPDGSISTESDAIQVLESAPNEAMNQAAIAAVSAYRPEARKVYQAFTFPVDIPYSATACQASKLKPSPSPTPAPKPKGQSASPTPSATPSNLPSASPQTSPTPTQPSASQSTSPLPSTPTPNPIPSSVSQPSSASPSAPIPEASTPSPSPVSPSPSPTTEITPSAPSLEPISPSIAVPESTPITPSTTP
jgi:outer membrane biosynthesis protein TonB